MTLQNVPLAPMFFTNLVGANATSLTIAVSNNVIDNSADKVGVCLTATESRTITKVRFRCGTITSAGGTTTVSINTVGADGKPSTTLWNSPTNTTSGTVTVSGSNTWQLVTLTAGASVTADQRFSIVLSTDGSPNYTTFQYQTQNSSDFSGPHCTLWLDNAGGGYAAVVSAGVVEIILEDADGPFYQAGLSPLDGAVVLQAISTAGTEEVALRFQVPFKARCRGIGVVLYNCSAASDVKATLWSSDSPSGANDAHASSLARSALRDGDSMPATTTDGIVWFWFTTPYTLAINTTYYAGIRNETAATANTGYLALPSITGVLGANGSGTAAYFASRQWAAGTASGTFTDDTAKIPQIALVIDQLDDGAGAGGGGGMRLAGHGGLAA